jgi:hypothetical protein
MGKEELIVTKDYKGEDRREHCDNCVKDRFDALVNAVSDLGIKVGNIMGASTWQKTIIIMLLGGGLSGSLVSAYVVIDKANTDGEQNTAIALIRDDVDSNAESVKELTKNVTRLVVVQEKMVTLMEERHKKEKEEEED